MKMKKAPGVDGETPGVGKDKHETEAEAREASSNEEDEAQEANEENGGIR